MDFTNFKLCRANDKRRNMQPYRLLSTCNLQPTPEFPCVPLTGNKSCDSSPDVRQPPAFPSDFFKSRAMRGCHQGVFIGSFFSQSADTRAPCHKFVDLSHNFFDSLSKTHFPGLKLASYIVANGAKPNQRPCSSTSSAKVVKQDQPKSTLISDHSAASFGVRSYANIVQQSAPKQSYADVTKMAAVKSSSESRHQGRAHRNRRPKRSDYFNRNGNHDRWRANETNWRERDGRKDERKPTRYVVERHPKYDPCRKEVCNNWRCRQHEQKSSPKQEVLRRAKWEASRDERKGVEVEVRQETEVPAAVEVEGGISAEVPIEKTLPESPASECPSWDSDSDDGSDDDSDDPADDRLREVNDRWRADNPEPVADRDQSQAKVRFVLPAVVHILVCWGFASRAARRGPWEQAARDRERFRLRVARSHALLAPVFDEANRRRAADRWCANES